MEKKRKPEIANEITPLLLESKMPPEPTIEAPAIKPVEPVVQETPAMPSEMQCTGAILLQAANYLIGVTYYITEVIKNQLNLPEKDLFAKTERLIYLPLFEPSKEAEKYIKDNFPDSHHIQNQSIVFKYWF